MGSVSKIKNMSCNRKISRADDQNLSTAEDLGTYSITSLVEKVLIEEGGKKVVERRTRTSAIHLPHRLGKSFQNIRLL